MSEHRRGVSSRKPVVEIALVAVAIPALVTFGVLHNRGGDEGDVSRADASIPSPSPTATPTATPTAGPTTSAPTTEPTTPTPTAPSDLDPDLRKRLKRILEAREEAQEDAPVTTDGPLGELTAPLGQPVEGTVYVAVAKIPNRSRNFSGSLGQLVASSPDFVTLNEVSGHSTPSIAGIVPAYAVHRAAAPDRSLGSKGQALNNAVLYRTSTWTQLAGGMVRIVDDDRGYYRGRSFVWDRFAVWSMMQREDGAIVSVISTHMPINPGKFPAQPGGGVPRTVRYSQGMDNVLAMMDQLSTYGPVLLAGDMNSHPNQTPWAAAPKMTAAGYRYVKDRGVMYLFYGSEISAVSSRQLSISSDHPALVATLDMGGSGPTA